MLSPQHCSQLQSPQDRLFSKCSASHRLVYTHRHMLRTLPTLGQYTKYEMTKNWSLLYFLSGFAWMPHSWQGYA